MIPSVNANRSWVPKGADMEGRGHSLSRGGEIGEPLPAPMSTLYWISCVSLLLGAIEAFPRLLFSCLFSPPCCTRPCACSAACFSFLFFFLSSSVDLIRLAILDRLCFFTLKNTPTQV